MRFFNIGNIKLIDKSKLATILPGRRGLFDFLGKRARYMNAILSSENILKEYGIDNAVRIAHFLGQGLIETGFLQYSEENLNYSAEGLMKTWPSRFPTLEKAKRYERNPKKIANSVYANRMGNGDEASGDGWRYRGSGFFQLTGKNNYKKFGDLAGVDLVNNPDIIRKDLKKSVEVAAAFFGRNGLGELADQGDIKAVSRAINIGNPNSTTPAHGEQKRIEWTRRALALVKDPNRVIEGHGVDGLPYDLGSKGEAVFELQQSLNALGYNAGNADGDYGNNTRRAVLAFQDEYGLATTGIVDEETQKAINDAMQDPRRFEDPSRAGATAADLRKAGKTDVSKTGQAGNAGAATSVAAAGAAANEAVDLPSVDDVIDRLSEPLVPSSPEETPAEIDDSIVEEPSAPQATPEEPATVDEPVETEAPAGAAPDPRVDDAPDVIIEEPAVDLVAPPAEEPSAEDLPVAPSAVPLPQPPVPAEPAPVDEIPLDEIPLDETPADETPLDEQPLEEKPLEEAPSQETPVETTPPPDAAAPPSEPPLQDEPETEPSPPEIDEDLAPREADTPPEAAPATPAPMEPQTEPVETQTEIAQPPPSSPPPAKERDMTTIAFFIAIAVLGVFIFVRSRQAVDDRVEDYRRR